MTITKSLQSRQLPKAIFHVVRTNHQYGVAMWAQDHALKHEHDIAKSTGMQGLIGVAAGGQRLAASIGDERSLRERPCAP